MPNKYESPVLIPSNPREELYTPGKFDKKKKTIHAYIYFWVLYAVPLAYYANTTVFSYYSFIIQPAIWEDDTSAFFLYDIILAIWHLFCYKFCLHFSISVKKSPLHGLYRSIILILSVHENKVLFHLSMLFSVSFISAVALGTDLLHP